MAGVVVELSGDEAKLLKAYKKVRDAQSKMDDGLKNIKRASDSAGTASEQAGRKMENSFGRTAANHLQNYVVGLGGVASAVRAITDALDVQKEAAEGAMAATDRLADSRMRLLQVQQGPDDRQQMENIADRLAAEKGITRDEARQLLFSARSEGFESAAPMIAGLAGAGVISVPAAARAAGQMPGLFPGSGLTPEQSLNATFLAGQQSRLSFEEISTALPVAAEGTSLIDTSPAETYAITSALASRYKSGQTAGDRIKALGAEINMDEDLRGQGVLAVIDELESGPIDRKKDFLKANKEVMSAYEMILQERAVIDQRQRQIQAAIDATGTEQSPLAMAGRVAVDPSTEAGRINAARVAANKAEARREIAQEQVYAESAFGRQAAVSRVEEIQMRRGVNALRRSATRKALEATRGIMPAQMAQPTAVGVEAVLSPSGAFAAQQMATGAPTSLAAASTALFNAAMEWRRAGQDFRDDMNQGAQQAAVRGVAE